MSDESRRWEDEPSQEGMGIFQDLKGVPHSPFKTKGEMVLAQQAEIANQLANLNNNLIEERSGNRVNNFEIIPPDISIYLPDVSKTKEFQNLLISQRRLVRCTESMGEVGRLALHQSELSNDHLEKLGEQGRDAWDQRNQILDILVQNNKILYDLKHSIGYNNQDIKEAILELITANQYLCEISDQGKITNEHLASLDKSGEQMVKEVQNLKIHHELSEGQRRQMIQEIAESNSYLSGINDGVKQVDLTLNNKLSQTNNLLAGIQQEVAAGIDLLHGDLRTIRNRIDLYGTAITELLSNVGDGIKLLSREIILTRQQISKQLRTTEDAALFRHNEQMSRQLDLLVSQKNIANILENPAGVQAQEAWRIAEECRLNHDFDNALRVIKKGLEANPSEFRLYFSWGLVALAQNKYEEARICFDRTAIIAERKNNPEFVSFSLLFQAKIFISEKRYEDAIEKLLSAIDKDVKNEEAWYEAAICYVKLGQQNKAIVAIKVILEKSDAAYRQKIMKEPCFKSLSKEIAELLN